MKSMHKEQISEQEIGEHTKLEKDILIMANNPFLMDMEYVFNTRSKVIYIMKFFRGGDLFLHLSNMGTFTEEITRFYAALMTLAVGYLHSQNIIYRDLKLENMLLDDNGYVVLIDFGVSKQL